MFSNLKTKKRLTQLLIAVVAVALTVTGSAFLLGDFVQDAKAYETTVNSAAEWTTAVSHSDSNIIIKLGQDLKITGKLTAIPSGKNVTLNMNGKTIQWYDVGSGNSGIISTSYPFSDSYWGLITNNGTLDIQGSGTISHYHIRYDNGNGSGQDDYGHKSSAIVNNGTLTVGSGITVENFAAQANNSDDAYQDMFIYSHGIYNTGTVNSSGIIQSGAFAMGVVGGSTNSWAHAFSYGIFGGNVNVNGGKIFSEAKSGYTEDYWTSGSNGNKAFELAAGVFSNNAVILGNTSITTKSTSWRDNKGDYNIWKNGWNTSWGVGVLYAGSNYPVIGADVSIDASFQHTGESEIEIKFPELNGKSQVFSYSRHSKSEPGSYGRRAYAVAGIPASNQNAMAGLQTSETEPHNALGVAVDGNASSTFYRSELVWRNGLTNTQSASGASQSGGNTTETKTSFIKMGAPGDNAGGQFMVYYRYWSNKKVIAASVKPDENINSAMTFSPANGVFTSDGAAISASGGAVKNDKFYKFMRTISVPKSDGNYKTGVNLSNLSGSDVTQNGNDFSGSFSATKGNSYIVFVDYELLGATNVKVVAEKAGTEVKKNSTNTEVSVTYTGNPIVPGSDFNIGVIDMKYDMDAGADNLTDNSIATDSYAVKNADETGKLTLDYSYSTDGVTFTSGLPTNVGDYTLKVVVPDDTNITRANAGNRNGGTFYLTLKITKAKPSISGKTTKSGTYGQTIAEIVPKSDFKAMSNGVDITNKGSWSYVGFAAKDCPTTEATSVKLQWTPDSDNAKNYESQTATITLTIAPRAVTVTPADSTVNYGAEKPDYKLNYSPDVSDSEKAAWLASAQFQVSADGAKWDDYCSSLKPGKYQLRLKSFGGDTANNNFSTNGTSTLTVNKAPLYYTATAQNKTYDGNTKVNVTLEYTAGAVNRDDVSMSLTTTGTLENANAGENKAVSNINTDIDYINKEMYNIVINNTPSVTVSKATPTATAKTYSFDAYDADRTLAKIDLTGESSVEGTWSWADATIVPSVNKTEYMAIFTPANTNYNTIEKIPVTITTAKKVVTVSVANQTITYGSAAPALNLVYSGFTGTDSIANVVTTGSIGSSSDYTMGKGVGTYPVTIAMTDYESTNYEFVAATDCVITVVKKNITVTAPSTTVTYGDAKPEFLVSQIILEEDALYSKDSLADLNTQAQFSITTTYEKGSPVADYDVVVSAAGEAANYEFTFVNGKVKVNKAVLTVTADNKTITYGDAAPYFTVSYSGWVTSDQTAPDGAAEISTAYIKGNDAGNYAISIKVGTLAHANYTFNVVGGTLTVNKLSINTAGKSVKANIVHGEKYSTAVFGSTALESIPGTFVLKDTNAVADYTAAENQDILNGNKYTVVTGIFTPADSDNYNAVEISVNLYIVPHEITGKPVITGTAMAGNTITASVAGMTPNTADKYTFKWYVDSAAAGSGATYTVKTADIGKSIYVVVTAIENTGYTGTAQSAAVTAVEAFKNIVSKDQLDITGISDAYIYDGANHGATVAVKAEYKGLVSENITVYYNGQTELPYNAGTYVVTVDVGTPVVPSGAEKDNYYGPVSGLEIGTIKIGKAPYTATFEVADKVYDGTRKVEYYNVVPNGKIAEDDVYLDSSIMSVVFAKANAGVHNIDVTGLRLAGDDAANYELKIESTTAKITKKTLYASAEGVERQFNGSAAVDVRFTVDANSYAAIDSATTVYVASATAKSLNVNAGTWKITDIKPVLGGTSAGNYTLEIVNENAFVTILKADLVVEAPVVSGDDLVYNADRKLSNIDLEKYYVKDGTGTWVFDNPDTVPTVRKTQYAATFVVPEDSNYNSYKTNITVVIKPKTVVLKAKDVTVSYGKAASYGVEYSGFTGTDSLLTMGGTQPSFTCEYVVGANVGDYTIKLNHNLDSNGNYEFAVETGTLKVLPAELYATATATDRPYNGSNGVEVKFAITSGLYVNDKDSDVKLSVSAANGVASSANAGTRIVTYTEPTLTGVKAKNYKLVVAPASGVLTVNISKLDPTGYVFPASATVPFGYSLSWAEFSNEAEGDGTFAFTKNNEIPAAIGSNYTYEVTFTPTDAVNYNTVTKYIPLTVTKCAVNYVAGITGKTQVGQKLSVSFTGLPSKAYDYIQYQWYRNTDNGPVAISGAVDATYSLTEADAGYEILCFTYFNEGDPFVFDEGVADFMGDLEGIFGATSGSISEENLTFWQRLVRWIENIIQALQGIMWGLGM